MTFTDEQQRDHWQPAMQIDMMSSEESGMEGDEEVMLIRPLPWRSEQVNRLMKQLDQKVESSRTPQARRQVINRVTSSGGFLPSHALGQKFTALAFQRGSGVPLTKCIDSLT